MTSIDNSASAQTIREENCELQEQIDLWKIVPEFMWVDPLHVRSHQLREMIISASTAPNRQSFIDSNVRILQKTIESNEAKIEKLVESEQYHKNHRSRASQPASPVTPVSPMPFPIDGLLDTLSNISPAPASSVATKLQSLREVRTGCWIEYASRIAYQKAHVQPAMTGLGLVQMSKENDINGVDPVIPEDGVVRHGSNGSKTMRLIIQQQMTENSALVAEYPTLSLHAIAVQRLADAMEYYCNITRD